jgi:hypothetical protein
MHCNAIKTHFLSHDTFLLKIFRCVVTTDNLIANVDGDVIQGEVQCQVLCNSLSGTWFNFKKDEGCQILRFCTEFQAEMGVITGPNTPPIDSCQKPSPIPKAKTDSIDLFVDLLA